MGSWLVELSFKHAGIDDSRTALGFVGHEKLKLKGAIVQDVEQEENMLIPRQGHYNPKGRLLIVTITICTTVVAMPYYRIVYTMGVVFLK